MKRYNFILLLLIMCAIFWVILNENYNLESIAIGFIISIICLLILQVFVLDSKVPDISLKLIFNLLVYFICVFFNVFKSSIKVSNSIIQNKSNIDRVIIDLPTKYTFINAIICNSITLTPGTITLEFNEDEAEIMVLNPNNDSKEKLKLDIEKSFRRLKNV
ncbi:MAG: Na+/H+ antiporter subunit E [Tissierellia bacterium]|nr:Na+/H+ antiporter subunit E [Tissierellia bacterium]